MKVFFTMIAVLVGWGWALADMPVLPPGFDRQRHMLVAEVKPGMKGYGLSVFSGTRIDRFEVEVISVLRNFNPRQDVVLIRASGCGLEHTGAIAGMSGSPIYLDDGSGKTRLIGAFAYGWPMVKDAVAGVQPIQYMLDIPVRQMVDAKPEAVPAGAANRSAPPAGQWRVLSSLIETRSRLARPADAPLQTTSLATTEMRPLQMPLTISGMGSQQVKQLAAALAPTGLAPLQAGGGAAGGGGGAANDLKTRIEPGSVLAVPMLTGDIDMTAVGTCTEVIGDKVYGFGHPFTSEGPVQMPLCGGQINGVIANLVTSFKLGSAGAPVGMLLADQSSGVAGRLGVVAATAPIDFRVRYADGSLDQKFHFQSVIHPRLTPMLASSAMLAAISSTRELPPHNTIKFRVKATFADGHVIEMSDTLSHVNSAALFAELAAPLSVAADNPFSRVLLQSMEGEAEISNTAREAQILSCTGPRQLCKPGDTVRFSAAMRPFREVDSMQPLEFKLPDDLAEGSYTIVVSDLSRYLFDDHAQNPHRFVASNIDEVFVAINDIGKMQSDRFYLRLVQNNPSVALGRTELNRLPGSRRQLLLGTNRSDVTAFMPSVTSVLPSKWVLSGSAELAIQVSHDLNKPPRQPK